MIAQITPILKNCRAKSVVSGKEGLICSGASNAIQAILLVLDHLGHILNGDIHPQLEVF